MLDFYSFFLSDQLLHLLCSSSTENFVTYIPIVYPVHQIWVVDLSLWINMLSRANNHRFGRRDIDERRLAGICVRDP